MQPTTTAPARLVLASTSPSRRSILENAGVQPVIAPADVDEDAIIAELQGERAPAIVQALSRAKAAAQAPKYPNDVVIGCDSMLLLDGQLQGKPHTIAKTIERWHKQRGKTATLLTGHTVIYGEQTYSEVSETTIVFAKANDIDIQRYAESGEPLACAGAFTLEALGGWFIDSIQGDPSSVIGLSLPVLRRALEEFGLRVSDFWA
ncbi:MAG: nucleoside triphosphate pyrophosphatase [Corynebacterium sp.]|nr:nucleoside triphosphate pyrophosphatase [Corynebacterium sp.]